MQKLPVSFFSNAESTGVFDLPWKIASGANSAACAVPVEFGGVGDGFSPEDLYLQALINCFIGTFKVIAKGSKINFAKVLVHGHLIVDKSPEGKTSMMSAWLQIKLFDCDRPDRAATIVAKTFKDGFILNSVKTEINYDLQLLTSVIETESISDQASSNKPLI